MKVYTPSMLADVDDGTVIPALRGTLKTLWPAKTGEGKYGPWTLQGAELVDEDDPDESIRLTFTFEADEDMRGETITMASVKNKKGVLGGLLIDSRTFTGQDGEERTQREVKVSKSCKIAVGEDSGTEDDGELPLEEKPKAKAAAKPATKRASDEIEGAESPKAMVKRVAEAVDRNAQLYEICIVRAAATIPWVKERFDEEMTREQFQAYVSALFISAERAGLAKNLPPKAKDYLASAKKKDTDEAGGSDPY